MNFLISLFVNAAVLVLVAKLMPKVHITGWGAAFLAAFLIGIFSPTIGWLLRAILNVATLGFFAVFGIGFIIRLVVVALIIKLVDWLMTGLKVEGYGTALIIAVVMALTGSLVQYLIY
ncbi:MAG: phage holin family protein [Candidatus Cyclobacteriaceae bacterium M2_1C_046]